MARKRPADATIGERIKARRELHGWSVRFAASRAGVSHATWSRIERGEQGADNRFTLSKIAEALRSSVTDLTGGTASADPTRLDTEAVAYETIRAVVEADLDYPPTAAAVGAVKPIDNLMADLALARSRWLKCDYQGAGRILAPTVRGLHATVWGTSDREDRALALRGLVLASETATYVARYGAGQPSAAALLAERGRQAATALGEPVITGLSDWTMAHGALGCGLHERGHGIATRAIDVLSPHATGDGVLEMLGALHLVAAFALYGGGRLDDALDLVAEADRIAQRTGDTEVLDLFFGPTNIKFWRVAMETDGGDPGKAVAIARDTNPLVVEAVMRQVSFYVDTARALARTKKDAESVRMLLTAERIAPQYVRGSALVAETARSLLDRAQRNAGGAELRGLCERVGVLN